MLKSCLKGRQTKIDFESKLSKLVERINLDRPILQKEKIKIILFEKSPAKENDQEENPTDRPSDEGSNKLKSSEIRNQLMEV